MTLTAPLYRLKRQARRLARDKAIPLHSALDLVARQEGFSRWSLLVARHGEQNPAKLLLARLDPGDLLLLCARPLQGKTLLALELAAEALKAGGRAAFFSLQANAQELSGYLQAAGISTPLDTRFQFNLDDGICARHIIQNLRGSDCLLVIDYLQLLDRQDTAAQIRALSAFAADRGHRIVLLSQVVRDIDPMRITNQSVGDIRLPGALAPSAFTKTCFLHDGRIAFGPTGRLMPAEA